MNKKKILSISLLFLISGIFSLTLAYMCGKRGDVVGLIILIVPATSFFTAFLMATIKFAELTLKDRHDSSAVDREYNDSLP